MTDTSSTNKAIRTAILAFSGMILCGCIQPPVFKNKEHAYIKSNYPIVAVDDTRIEKTYQLETEAGTISLVAVYSTYQYDYFCTFSWSAKAGTVYEITDHENRYPLTLYRWHRKNGAWAIRLDPVDPQTCTQQSK